MDAPADELKYLGQILTLPSLETGEFRKRVEENFKSSSKNKILKAIGPLVELEMKYTRDKHRGTLTTCGLVSPASRKSSQNLNHQRSKRDMIESLRSLFSFAMRRTTKRSGWLTRRFLLYGSVKKPLAMAGFIMASWRRIIIVPDGCMTVARGESQGANRSISPLMTSHVGVGEILLAVQSIFSLFHISMLIT